MILGQRSYSLAIFAGLTALFLIPAFKYWTGGWIYPIDWVERIIIVALVVWIAARTGEIVFPRPTWPRLEVQALWWIIAIALCFGIFWVSGWIGEQWPGSRWMRFPAYPSPAVEWIDLTLGIALVALSEELAFRWFPSVMAKRGGWSASKLYWISGIGFVLIHIPQGPNTMVLSFFFACMLMAFQRRYNTILAPIALHYLYDVLAFSGAYDAVFYS